MTSITLRGGYSTTDRRLDRVPSANFDHIDKYPLTAAMAAETDESVVIGVNWYSNFDHPVLRRIAGRDRYIIGDGDLGHLRGGHAVCLRHHDVHDTLGWYNYYDQGDEGRCVEFACMRERSLANRVRYDITSRWHYFMMQQADEWQGGSYPGADPVYDGTSVRAGQEVMRAYGLVRARPRGATISYEEAASRVTTEDATQVYRWATDWNDVRTVLSVPDDMPGVPLLNSWGNGYPKEVLLLDEAGARLLAEDGEFAVVTDK